MVTRGTVEKEESNVGNRHIQEGLGVVDVGSVGKLLFSQSHSSYAQPSLNSSTVIGYPQGSRDAYHYPNALRNGLPGTQTGRWSST